MILSCYAADVGYNPDGPQVISLDKNCLHTGTIVHEFVHIIGLQHEHTRPDRDQYVTINFENIESDQQYRNQFDKAENMTTLSPYDVNSIMHYGSTAFSKDKQQITIAPKDSNVKLRDSGEKYGLSNLDIEGIIKYYNCTSSGSS